MRREVRANLIFFGILIPLLVPGFVILMNKKLSGSAEPNYLPHPVPTSVAYMQPAPVPPGLPRVEPPEVRAWVGKLLQEKVDPSLSMTRRADERPVMSDSFRTQLLRAGSPVVLLVWDDDVSGPGLALTLDGQPAPAPGAQPVDVPLPIRRALQGVGYIDPPQRVWLVTLPDARASSSVRLRFTRTNDKPVEESITLP